MAFIHPRCASGWHHFFVSSIYNVFDAGGSFAEFNDKLLQRSSLQVIGGTQKIFQVPKFMCALWSALIGQMSYVRDGKISVNWNPVECLLGSVLTYETPNGWWQFCWKHKANQQMEGIWYIKSERQMEVHDYHDSQHKCKRMNRNSWRLKNIWRMENQIQEMAETVAYRIQSSEIRLAVWEKKRMVIE